MNSNRTQSVFEVTLPPSADTNAWPWTQYLEQHRNQTQPVKAWNPWQYEFRVNFGVRTHRFKGWHYTTGPTGRGPGMYGSIEQRDVWGLAFLRSVIVIFVRTRFARKVEGDD